MSRILVVDDEQSICWGLEKLGKSMGHAVETASSAETGIAKAEEAAVDLLILDVRLPGMDGLTAIEHFRTRIGDAPIIVITAFGDLQTAVKAVQGGAFEYLLKPFDLAAVRAAIERALRHAPDLRKLPQPSTEQDEIVGQTPVMQAFFKQIALAAGSGANVVIHGESGVGKELAARAIHRHSARAEAKLVTVNVAALSPSLAESELFGHVAGAFTGANQAREGLLVQADGGTLFLDEVAEIPLPLQVKLLRALEQGEVFPVGSDRPVPTRFRIIAATHQDLQETVRAGKFRHDLYYRLCSVEIEIPPLRERVDDIPRLAEFFAAKLRREATIFAEETIAELKRRPWHGNVRELRNAVEHSQVVAQHGTIMPEHLPPAQPSFHALSEKGQGRATSLTEASYSRARELLDDPKVSGSIYDRFLREAEVPLLKTTMERFDNEYAPAARALGMHRTTLKKKLSELKNEEEAR